jgi:hypothetical protein
MGDIYRADPDRAVRGRGFIDILRKLLVAL